MARVLGLFDLIVLASASMGPAFSLAGTMGPMVEAGGSAAPYALLAVTGVMACIAVAFSRLLAVLPSAGSSYSWMSAAFGPSAGAYAGWILILGNFIATLATSIPAGTYTLDLVAPSLASSPLWTALIGMLWILAAAVLLYCGARPTAHVTAVLLVLEFGVLFAAAIAAVFHPAAHDAGRAIAAPHIGLGGWITAMVIGIWMLDGWEVSASASEESSGGRQAPGDGGMVGLLMTSGVLFLCMLAFMHVGTVAGFTAHLADSMAYVADQLGGPAWHIAIFTVVLISIAGSLQTTLLYLSRSVFAMGRDRVLPPSMGRLDRRGIPAGSILAVTAILVVVTLATGLWPDALSVYNLVVDGSAVFLGTLFLFSSVSAVRLFAGDTGNRRLTGVVIPAVGSALLAVALVWTVFSSDHATIELVVGGALLGIPFALWRRGVAPAPVPSAAPAPAAPEG